MGRENSVRLGLPSWGRAVWVEKSQMVSMIPELGLLSIKQWKACMSQCPFRHSFFSHCTAHIRTLDLHTFVSFALLAFLHLASHWCHSHFCLSNSCCTSRLFFALPNNGELLRRRLATNWHVAHQHQKHHRGKGGDKVSIKLYVHNNAVASPLGIIIMDQLNYNYIIRDNTCGHMSHTAVQATGRRSCLLDDVRELNDVWAFVEEEAR